MQSARFIHAIGVVLGSLIAPAHGAGVAVFKEQPFHADSSAVPVVYSEILPSGLGSGSIRLLIGGREVVYQEHKYAGHVDIPPFPATIRSEHEKASLRYQYDELKKFHDRFTKCAKILQPYVDSFARAVSRVDSGEVLMDGSWLTPAQLTAMLQREREVAAQVQMQKTGREAAAQKNMTEAEVFEKSQRGKGLEKFKDEWLPAAQARQLQEALKEIRFKSVYDARFKVVQALSDGAFVSVLEGRCEAQLDLHNIFIYSDPWHVAEGEVATGHLFWCDAETYLPPEGGSQTVHAFCLDEDAALQRVRHRLLGEPDTASGKTAPPPEVTDSAKPKLPAVLEGADGTGSGFFVGNEGYFVTSTHAIKGATRLQVYYQDKTYEADVVKMDARLDLAVLKVPLAIEGFTIEEAGAAPGDDVLALGFPVALLQDLAVKVTKGVISSSRGMHNDDRHYQLDAAIQPGSSGGPVCNAGGHLVGVTAARMEESATGATPPNVNHALKAREVIALLKSVSVPHQIIAGEAATTRSESPVQRATRKTALVIRR